MFARNSDLCRLAASSSSYRRLSSSFIRFTLAASAPSSSRFSTSTWPEKSPDAIAASRASIRWIGPTSDHDSTNPSNRASTSAPAATPMNRFRELANELAFWSISPSTSARVPSASSRHSFEVAREPLCLRSDVVHLLLRGAFLVERDESFVQQEPRSLGGYSDILELASIFRRGHEEQLGRRGTGSDEANSDSRVSVDRGLVLHAPYARPDVAEAPSRVLRHEQAEVPRVPLELSVTDGALPERTETPDAVVRLPEDALPEQSDATRSSDVPTKATRSFVRTVAGRRATARTRGSSSAQRPSLVADGRSPLVRGCVGHGLSRLELGRWQLGNGLSQSRSMASARRLPRKQELRNEWHWRR